MSKIQILAPAGSQEALIAAVRCGADAVYLGGSAFNARRNAQNFSDTTLAESVAYCHIHGVKVYFTLNTVIFDREFPALYAQIAAAAQAGVDAFIVQDLGVLSALDAICPDIPRIASTQMALHNSSGVAFAKSLGFRRAVLARELTEQEITQIARSTDLELEVFVHGALCMCVSGQCYLSAMIGQRSGNRGLCAQPCRLPFSPNQKDACYALSLKDLSLVPQMQALIRAGVTSLKIEGRMKRPEYVAAAVTACRMAIDGKTPDLETLAAVFSRSGFTDGYFSDARTRNMFGTRQKEDVLAAKPVLAQLRNSYKDEVQTVPVSCTVTIAKEQPVRLFCQDAEGHRAEASGAIPEPALTREISDDIIRKSLLKTGQTAYRITELSIRKEPGLSLRVSDLNDLRRNALARLDAARSALPERTLGTHTLPTAPPQRFQPTLRVRLFSPQQLSPYLAAHAERIALPPEALKEVLSRQLCPAEQLEVDLPRVSFDDAALEQTLVDLRASGVTHAIAHTAGDLPILRKLGFTISASFTMNITNSAAVKRYAEQGVSDCTLSFETDMADAQTIAPLLPIGLTVYGRLPLMVFRNCPIRAQLGCRLCRGSGVLYDRTKAAFPVECGDRRYSQLLNSVPLNLSDRQKDLSAFSFLSLYFTRETRDECETALRAFVQKTPLTGSYTHGLYYRTVL